MTKFGKNIFEKDFSVKADVTNGKCPLCESPTVFVSIHSNFYRCMSCGARNRKKIGRHKKNMNKSEKLSYKPYVGQGR